MRTPRYVQAAALCGLAFLLAAALPVSAQVQATPAERALLSLLNRTRVQYGLGPLAWDSALARAARGHAERILIGGGALEHKYAGEPDLLLRASRQGARFSGLGENIARGAQTPAELHDLWMHTTAHRGNILSRRWNAVGIGVLESHGALYAVEDFADSNGTMTDSEVELAVADALHRAGVFAAESSSRARAACVTGVDPAGVALVVTWDGPDPAALPPELLERLRATPFHQAEIGVCPGHPQDPHFTTVRVAVLLR